MTRAPSGIRATRAVAGSPSARGHPTETATRRRARLEPIDVCSHFLIVFLIRFKKNMLIFGGNVIDEANVGVRSTATREAPFTAPAIGKTDELLATTRRTDLASDQAGLWVHG